MRPIDAERLKAVLEKNFGHTGGASVLEQLIDEQPTIQPQSTTGQLNDGARSTAQSTDLIDRRAAIDALDCINGVEEVLRSLPPVQPKPQWIPVERELPEDFTDVLVWFEYFRYGNYNRMCATHGIGNYSKGYNSWTINHETGWKDLHVFAWMPLPIPYQKGAIK